MVSRTIWIKWGRGQRKVRVKNFSQYEKIGKYGRYNLYTRKKKKRKQKKKTFRKTNKVIRLNEKGKRRITQEETHFIQLIKGKKPIRASDLKREREIEKRMLHTIRILPVFKTNQYKGTINPENKIITNGKIYGNFHSLDIEKRDIYLNLMGKLIQAKNQKFKDKLYAMRKELLQDGIVLETEIYGILHKQNKRRVYFGTLALVGLMIEDASFIETDMIGWGGENREIERYFDQLTRSKGGQRAYWIKNNLRMDTTEVTITDVKIKLNYA